MNNGCILNLSVDECIDLNQRGSLDYAYEADLETFVKDLYLYTDFFSSEDKAIGFYKEYFEITENDNEYLNKKVPNTGISDDFEEK